MTIFDGYATQLGLTAEARTVKGLVRGKGGREGGRGEEREMAGVLLF